MTSILKILQELIRKSDEEKICEALHIPIYYRGCLYSRFTLERKSDEEKICEALHIPIYYRGCIYSRFTLETNNRLIQAGLIGHYKITDNQKVEISVNEIGYFIRIICRAIRQSENGEAEEVNAELRVSFFEFEQDIDIDSRMEENIRRVIFACDRLVHERSIKAAEEMRKAEAIRRMNHEEEKQ